MSKFAKLLNIQRDLKCDKSQFNEFGKYNYRSCEDILEAVKPLCVREGVALLISDTIEQIGGKNYIKATVELHDTEDDNLIATAAAYAREPDEKKGMDDSQITGAASSYARKYALNALFAIDDTKDADSDESPQEANSTPTAAQKKQASKSAQSEDKPLTLKEAMQESVKFKRNGKEEDYRLGALSERQLDWVIENFDGRTKEAAKIIRREKFKSALEDEQEEIPF